MTRVRRRHPLPLLPFKLLETEEHERQREGHTRRERQATFEWPGAPFLLEYRETQESLPGWSTWSRIFTVGSLSWLDDGGEGTFRHDDGFHQLEPLTAAVWPLLAERQQGALGWRPGMIRHLPISAAFLDAAMRNAGGTSSPYAFSPFQRWLGEEVAYPARAPEHLPRLRVSYPELAHFSDGQVVLAWQLFSEQTCSVSYRGLVPPHRTAKFLGFVQTFTFPEEERE